MRNKDLIQRAIQSCMNRIGLPYNGAFKVKYNDKTECTKCPAWSCNDGCFFIDSYIPNGIVENLGIQHHLPIPRDYKYKNKFLCKCRDYKELIGDTNE